MSTDREIDVLWRAEALLHAMLTWPGRPSHPDDAQILWDLLDELKRIRILRVKRQSQRRRSKHTRRTTRPLS